MMMILSLNGRRLLPSEGGEAVDEDLDGVGEVHAIEVVLVDLALAVGQLRPLHLGGVALGAGVPRRHDGGLKMRFFSRGQKYPPSRS